MREVRNHSTHIHLLNTIKYILTQTLEKLCKKLQKIQSLEKFVSIAIQGTQVPMYTNTHCFCIFLIFQFFFNFYEKQSKAKLKNKQTKTC